MQNPNSATHWLISETVQSTEIELYTENASVQPTVQITIERLKSLGLPALPVAPAQDPYKYYVVQVEKEVTNKKGETAIQDRFAKITKWEKGDPIEWESGSFCPLEEYKPIATFTGKNPSYLDNRGKPRIVAHGKYKENLPTDRETEIWFSNPLNGVGTLGGINGIYWLDPDKKQFDSQDHCDRWVKATGLLNSTWVEKSPNGGYHLAIRLQKSPGFTNFYDSEDKQRGELIGVGRFVVLAPSNTVLDRPFYQCLNYNKPIEIPDLEKIGIFAPPSKRRKKAAVYKPKSSISFSIEGANLPTLISKNAQQILIGNGTGDRSNDLTTFGLEVYGWVNWLTANQLNYSGDAEQLFIEAGEALGLDSGKIGRILNSFDQYNCLPACVNLGGDDAAWQKIKKIKTLEIGLPYLESEDGKIKLAKESQVANYLFEKYRDILIYDSVSKSFWVYSKVKEGLWTEITENGAKSLVTTELDASPVANIYTPSYVRGIVELIEIKVEIREWKETKGLIPCRNGVYNLKTQKLEPHQSGYRFRWQLPYDFDPSIEATPIINWLIETFNGDKRIAEIIRAYLWCTLTGQYQKKFAELIGESDAGKSVLSRLTEALIGSENTVATTLSRLAGKELNRFEFARYVGKKLIVINETESYGENFNIIKALTGGDVLPIERKGKDIDTKGYVFEGMMLFVGNEPIKFPSKDKALLDRRILIPFTRSIPKSQQRSLLDIYNGEPTGEFVPYLSGLLNWVLSVNPGEAIALVKDGYKEILQQSQRELLAESNPMVEWLETYCGFQVDAKSPIGTAKPMSFEPTKFENWETHLFPSYMTFIRSQGLKSDISLQNFSTSVVNLANQYFGETLTIKRGNKGKLIHGIYLKPLAQQGMFPQCVEECRPCRPSVDPSVDLKPNSSNDCVDYVDLNEKNSHKKNDDLEKNIAVHKYSTSNSYTPTPTVEETQNQKGLHSLHNPDVASDQGLHGVYTGSTPSTYNCGDRSSTGDDFPIDEDGFAIFD